VPQQVPYYDMGRELLVASDATLIAYRKLLKRYAAQPLPVEQAPVEQGSML